MKKFSIKVDGVIHEVEVEEIGSSISLPVQNVQQQIPTKQNSSKAETKQNVSKVSAGAGSVVAPLQGTLQSLKVKVGDSVKSGDVVAVIEAMKMENDIPANVSGTVKAIHVSVGAKVSSGDVLLDIG